MKYTIDRRTWLRGEGEECSSLCRSFDMKRCCIGQASEQRGVPVMEMLDIESPDFLDGLGGAFYGIKNSDNYTHLLPDWWFINSKGIRGHTACISVALQHCMVHNDNKYINDETRERMIKDIFIKHGDELEFVN